MRVIHEITIRLRSFKFSLLFEAPPTPAQLERVLMDQFAHIPPGLAAEVVARYRAGEYAIDDRQLFGVTDA